jgi:outer membrane protein assembly factor BamB
MRIPVAVALSLGLAAGAARAADVPMFRGGPSRVGTFDAPGVPQFKRVKWSFHTGDAVVSSPAVVGNVIYVGSNDHNLYAIDATTGALLWKFPTHSRVAASPAVADGVVFVGSYDGAFYAVDAATGKEKWHFLTTGERRFSGSRLHGMDPVGEVMPDPYDVFLSSPAVADGLVYFGSGDRFIYALDVATGQQKWRGRTGDVVHASPTVADGMLYVGSWDAYFYAFDAKTGAYQWHFMTGTDPIIHNQVGIQSSAAYANGMLYFGCRDSMLYALDAKTGEKKWSFDNHGSWVVGSPSVRDGKVYFATSDSALFHVVDALTGVEEFKVAFKWPMFSSPALAGDRAYVGANDGRLLAIDLKSHQLAWSFQTEGSKKNAATYTKPDGSPNYEAAVPDSFYDSVLAGLQKLQMLGPILSSPAVVGNVVYVGSSDGNVYALE